MMDKNRNEWCGHPVPVWLYEWLEFATTEAEVTQDELVMTFWNAYHDEQFSVSEMLWIGWHANFVSQVLISQYLKEQQKASPKKLVLFDSQQGKYLMKPTEDTPKAGLTPFVSQAWVFEESEIDAAWEAAYKAAWLGLGEFFVHVAP